MKTQRDLVKSARRALDLLEFIGAEAEPPTFQTLCDQLKIPRSSLSHLMTTLIERGYVERVEGRGGFQLGEATRKLARNSIAPLLGRIETVLRKLADELDENAGYYVRADDDAKLVAIELSRQPLMFNERWGHRAPLYAISAGKVLLAAETPLWLDAYLARTQFKTYTPATVASREDLERQIAAVRRTGIGRSLEEYDAGVVGVARAVEWEGTLRGAVAVTLPAARYNEEVDARITEALAQAYEQLARK